MKRIILAIALMTSFCAAAQQTTLILEAEYISGNAKYCVYSNASHTETVEVSVNTQCRHTETFDAD